MIQKISEIFNYNGGFPKMEKFNLSDLIITRVRSATTLYTPENATAKRTDRARWAVVLKYEGETVYSFGGKQLVSDACHVVLLPKGSSYEWRCTKPGHCAILELECTACGGEPVSVPVKSSEQLLQLFRELEYKLDRNKPLTKLESLRDAYTLLLPLAKLGTEPYAPTEKQQKIVPALEYVARNYNKNITNDRLAAMTGLSTVYFRRLFTEVTGVSPMAYARQLRIEKAKQLLRSDYGTLTDLALSLGYASLYDFSRDFKKHTGVPPSAY